MRLLRTLLVSGTLGLALLTGCTTSVGRPTGPAEAEVSVAGSVHGGQEPVSGAAIQLYAVGTSADGSASVPLLATPLLTNQNGDFTLAGFTCGSATEVYLIASGGNSGGGQVNPNLTLMTALGPCSSITSSSFIAVNELTSVAATAALAPFESSITAIGSGSSDAPALAAAFQLAAVLVNPATGQTPGLGVPSGMAVPTATINTLADAMANCVNSSGGLAGSMTPCGTFFNLTHLPGSNAPTDTVTALFDLADDPTLNTQPIYQTVLPLEPFQPVLPNPPADFSIKLLPLNTLAALTLSTNGLAFPTAAVGFAAQPMSVTISNSNSAAIPLTGITISGMNASDFAETDNCGGTIAAVSSCLAQVTFTPGGMNARVATLSVASNAAGSPQTVALSGSGGAPSAGPVSLSTTKISWTMANTLADVTVENYGNTPLTIRKVSTGNANFNVETNGCGTSVPAQSVCTITVESTGIDILYDDSFSTPTTYTDTLTIDDDASAGDQTVALTSTNVDSVGPDEVVFNSWPVGLTENGPTLADSLSYYSSGGFGLTLSGANAGDFSIAPTSCSKSAGMDDDCALVTSFKPSATGLRKAIATVSTYPSSGTSSGQYIRLSGTGDPAGPSLITVPATSYGDRIYLVYGGPTTDTKTINLLNNGSTTLNLAFGVSGSNGANYTAQGSQCGSLATGASCRLTVNFSGNTTGTFTATIDIRDQNSALIVPYTVSTLVVYPSPASTPSTVIFPDQAVNTTSPLMYFEVGTVPINQQISVSQPVSGNFTLPNGSVCPASTTQVCTFAVAFTPQSTGPLQESLTITSLTSGNTASVELEGTGGVPVVSLTPSTLMFPARAVGTTSVPMTVTLKNMGSQPLTITSVSLRGVVNGNYTESTSCSTVQVNATCTISVTFAPSASGTQNATLNIVSNAASSPDTVMISGTAQ